MRTLTDIVNHEPLTEPVEPAKVGDVLPKALGAAELCEAFGISYTTFYRLQQAGEFKPFELSRPIGRKRWSGEKVQAFLNGRK